MRRLFLSAVFLASGASATEYVVSPDGLDSAPGTQAQPLRTVEAAARVMRPGDACTLRGGRYEQQAHIEGLKGEEGRPVVFRPAPGETAVLDGTTAIQGRWKRHRGAIYKTTITFDVWQLFVDGKMLNAARWPNAGFLDDDVPATRTPAPGSIWDRERTWGRSAKTSTPGHMIDVPGINSLAATDMDMTGAVAILNIGSFKTADSLITRHAAGSGEFDYDLGPLKGQLSIQKPERSRYYIEGKLGCLDAPGEWFYDRAAKTLYVWTRDGTPPGTHEVRGKTQSYAVALTNCSYVVVRGIDFLATTLRAEGCRHITVEDCRFRYPSHSKRMLRVFKPTAVTRIGHAGEGGPARSGNIIRNCEFAYTEGEALIVESHGVLVENCLFHHIDATCSRLVGIGNSISMHRSADSVFRRNTVRVCGASETLCAGPRMLAELNRFSQTGYVQNDGAMIHFMQGQAVNSITRFNWLHDSVKSGYRIDGPLDIGNTGEKGKWVEGRKQTKGTIYGNVMWNCSTGLMVKGDYHTVAHNTGLDCTAKDISLINVLPAGGNQHSLGRNNAAGAMDGYRGNRTRVSQPLPPLCSSNWIGVPQKRDVRDLLRDPANLDFRPRLKSPLVDAGTAEAGVPWEAVGRAPDIGAYESAATHYWVPGRQLPTASTPIPPDGSETVKAGADLMWLQGLNATAHEIYFGTSRDAVARAWRSSPEFRGRRTANIVSPGKLRSGQTYYWRVDAVVPPGPVRGPVWRFTVGGGPTE